MLRSFLLVLLLSFVSSSSVAVAQGDALRFWTTQDGVRSTVRLKLIERDGNVVQLQREDNGRLVKMHLSRLSKADRDYLTTIVDAPGTKAGSGTSTSEWPQWRGRNRDGKSSQTGLLSNWGSQGPELVWSIQGIGQGFSTPTVANQRVYVLGTLDGREQVFCLDEATGQNVWTTPLGAIAEGGGYKGPRGSATIHEGRVHSIGSDGSIACMDAERGSVLWAKNLKRDFGGADGHWAYAESPLIDGNKLICTPGGDSATLVALNVENGSVIWTGVPTGLKGGYTQASYASTISATLSGTKQYIAFLSGGVVGFDSDSGRALWHYDAPANGTANCSTPVADDRSVFAASGYGTGGGKARITGRGTSWNASEQFFVNKFQNHHGGFVLVDDFLYGTNDNSLLCVDWNSGNVRWQDRSVGKGAVCYADGKLIVRSENGPVALVAASPDGYQELGRFEQPDRSGQKAWPHPVVAGGRLYLRDWDRLMCFRIAD